MTPLLLEQGDAMKATVVNFRIQLQVCLVLTSLAPVILPKLRVLDPLVKRFKKRKDDLTELELSPCLQSFIAYVRL